MVNVIATVLLLLSVNKVYSQPGGVSGQSTSTACTTTSGTCAVDGSSNYMTRSLTYNTTTGKFTGSITTNLCSNDKYSRFNGVLNSQTTHSPNCISQTFPAPSYTTLPAAAPLRSNIGYSIRGGANIFGPFENGFANGEACSNGYGMCDAGLDVGVCEDKLSYECGSAYLQTNKFMDDCGGHANPYHYHIDLACDYNKTASGHSTIVGLALDGRGIYGLYETTGTVPTDLDACGGHFGTVPGITIGSDTYAGATNVYHYHTTGTAPFTVGCFGPVATLDQCKALYATCNTGYVDLVTSSGCIKNYDTDCPCFKNSTATYNQITTAACSNVTKSTNSYMSNTTNTTTTSSVSGNAQTTLRSSTQTTLGSSTLTTLGSGSQTTLGSGSQTPISSSTVKTTGTLLPTATDVAKSGGIAMNPSGMILAFISAILLSSVTWL